MRVMEALTKLVMGASRLGDHLLRQKVAGVIVAALAFACGAGLAHALKGEPRQACAAVEVKLADPARAEVSMSDTPAVEAENEGADETEEKAAVFAGRYENYVYGYSVEIPEGLVGLGSTPPAPQHGFVIDLEDTRALKRRERRDSPRPYVSVDGSYNSLMWTRLDEAAADQLTYLREKGVPRPVLSKTRTTLAGLPALRVVAHYERGGETWVSDDIVALRRSPLSGEVSVAYTLDMDTPLSRYERDRPVLEALLKSWCLQPVE